MCFDHINKQKCVATELHTKYVLTMIKITEMYIAFLQTEMCFDRINKQKCVATEFHTKYVLTMIKQ